MKRWLGVGFVDVAIQAVLTVCVIGALVDSPGTNGGETVVFGTVFVSVAILALRRYWAFRHRPASELSGEVAADRLAELEARLTDLELMQVRIMELEDRLDFAERLLAQRQDAMLPGRGAGT